ncbi:MAG: YdcF family protein [Chloroflexi bacterium]|nr:YdcF family protein [Chloroflexota bacterium]
MLGAAVWDDQPSPVFAERINHAINLYKNGQVEFIIFTGGVGDGEQLAESLVAANYAIANGVAVGDTFCETSSKITLENLQGAQEIVQQQGIGRVVIVSDPLHMRRSIMMAQDLGLDAHSSPTSLCCISTKPPRSIHRFSTIPWHSKQCDA